MINRITKTQLYEAQELSDKSIQSTLVGRSLSEIVKGPEYLSAAVTAAILTKEMRVHPMLAIMATNPAFSYFAMTMFMLGRISAEEGWDELEETS